MTSAAIPSRAASDRITWMQYVCSLLIVVLHARNGDSMTAASASSSRMG